MIQVIICVYYCKLIVLKWLHNTCNKCFLDRSSVQYIIPLSAVSVSPIVIVEGWGWVELEPARPNQTLTVSPHNTLYSSQPCWTPPSHAHSR